MDEVSHCHLKDGTCWHFENILQDETVCLDSEVDNDINWLQQEYVKREKDWREIDKRMSQTLEIRRKLIGSRTPLKDILKMFPFLKCPYQVSLFTWDTLWL